MLFCTMDLLREEEGQRRLGIVNQSQRTVKELLSSSKELLFPGVLICRDNNDQPFGFCSFVLGAQICFVALSIEFS
jgi:hypothetical protein